MAHCWLRQPQPKCGAIYGSLRQERVQYAQKIEIKRIDIRTVHLVNLAHELVATGTDVTNEQWRGPLYTAEVNPRVRLYQCTECRRRWELGSGDIPATIEALKEKGCPACGNHHFRRTIKSGSR